MASEASHIAEVHDLPPRMAKMVSDGRLTLEAAPHQRSRAATRRHASHHVSAERTRRHEQRKLVAVVLALLVAAAVAMALALRIRRNSENGLWEAGDGVTPIPVEPADPTALGQPRVSVMAVVRTR